MSTDKRFAFTRETLKNLPSAPAGKRDEYQDTRVPSLRLRVTASGAKTFCVYRRINGRPDRVTIGTWPDLPIEFARKRAEELNSQIAQGLDPKEEARRLRNEATIADLCDWYVEHHAKVRKKTWQEDVRTIDRYMGPITNRQPSSLDRRQIREWHAGIGRDHGHYAANRTLELLSSIFNVVAKEGVYTGGNPAAGIDGFPEKSRDRRLTASELPTFLEAVENEPNAEVRDFVLLALFTGARRGNVCAMRWDQLDLVERTWRIPETKNGTPQVIALGEVELAILRERDKDKTCEWVLPNQDRTGPITTAVDNGWRRILARAGITDLRIHDLRRTLGSWMVDTGASLPMIGKALNHKTAAATQIYARLALDPVREAKRKATEAIMDAARWKR